MRLFALLPVLSLACTAAPALPDAAAAEAVAIALVGGGSATTAQRVTEDDHDLWETTVTVPNGAALEVLLFVDDAALFEVKDPAGPWDYDTLDPLPGQLTYAQARQIAFDTVAGDLVLWKVEYDDGPYYYEFYIDEAGGQLWEVKLWADDGEVFVTEAKDAVD